jgi:hypothetical protein
MNTHAPAQLVRLKRGETCVVCGHRGWCTRTADGAVVNCMRVNSDRPTKNGGWLHRLGETVAGAEVTRKAERPGLSRAELTRLAESYRTSVNPERLTRFADSMGLTVESLRRLRTGWAHDRAAWTFPMQNATGAVTGIRLRLEDGRKLSVTGGREGLFVPDALDPAGPLLMCEGPTSCAALLDMGFAAVGRPSCSGGVELVRVFLHAHRRDVVILGDHDSAKPRPDGSSFYPGQDGAARLAREVVGVCRSLKVIVPPNAKDARDWKRAGATRAVVEAVIRAVNYVRRE